MSVVTYSSFLKEVVPFVPDVPETVALNAIRNACIEFCEKSAYVVRELDAIDVLSGIGNYTLDLPTDTVLGHVREVWFEKSTVQAASEEELRGLFQSDWREKTGTPTFYTMVDACELVLCPEPDANSVGGLKVIVTTIPSRDSVTVDDTLYERWAETIGHGARARLHEQPGQPYSNPQAAQYCWRMFSYGVERATVQRNRGLTRTNMSVRFPRFV